MPSASKFLLTDEALASCKNGIKAFTQEIEKPLKVAQERAQERQRKAMKARIAEEAKQHRRVWRQVHQKGFTVLFHEITAKGTTDLAGSGCEKVCAGLFINRR